MFKVHCQPREHCDVLLDIDIARGPQDAGDKACVALDELKALMPEYDVELLVSAARGDAWEHFVSMVK